MKPTNFLVLLLLLFGMGCQDIQPEPQALMAVPTPVQFEASTLDPLQLIVWLETDKGLAESNIVCFNDKLDLENRTNVMVHSVRFGPIGVKEVIDALRIAPDEPGKGRLGKPKLAGSLQLQPAEIVQVVWRPAERGLFVHPVTVVNPNCGVGMNMPLPPSGPGFVLRDIDSCAPVSFRRGERGGRSLNVYVGESCTVTANN